MITSHEIAHGNAPFKQSVVRLYIIYSSGMLNIVIIGGVNMGE